MQRHDVALTLNDYVLTPCFRRDCFFVSGIILASAVGRREAAVVVFRTVQSLGLVLVFLLDIWLTLLTQICISGAILVTGVITYMILEVIRSPVSSAESFPYAL